MWASADHIDRAHQMDEDTAERRAVQRQRAAERREAREADYQSELAEAIVAYLDFADEHTELARQIADGAATTAAEVGSGRVGRTAPPTSTNARGWPPPPTSATATPSRSTTTPTGASGATPPPPSTTSSTNTATINLTPQPPAARADGLPEAERLSVM